VAGKIVHDACMSAISVSKFQLCVSYTDCEALLRWQHNIVRGGVVLAICIAYVVLFVVQVVSGRASKAVGPFKEAVVFMIGGGNYLEYESLSLYASKSQPPKNILYGATDIISPEAFAKQLADLGKRAGGL